jgi:conjugative relaxase-like TrwC/TraI family protein
VLTIRPISAQSLGYYDLEDSVQASQEVGYYEAEAKGRGQWFGKGCRALDLSGEVDSNQYRNVFQGFSPTRTVALVQNAGRTEGERARRPGFDFTFSAPKEFSLLYAATTSSSERDRLLECHDDAVVFVLNMIEDRLAKCRIGKAGKQLVDAKGLVVARFPHFSSRENDPQVHTHALVANLAQGPDGRWRALASTLAFKKGFMKRYGTLYREVLASNLEMVFNLQVNVAFGYVRIPGIPAETKAYYSKRRAQIESVGYRDAREAGQVAIRTRRKKDGSIATGALSSTWREELAKVFGPDFTVEKLSLSQRELLHRGLKRPPRKAIGDLTPQHGTGHRSRTKVRERSPSESHRVGSEQEPQRTERASATRVRPLPALLDAVRSRHPSPVTVALATSLRRLSPRERFRVRHIARTSGDKKLGQVSSREVAALSSIFQASGMRMLALTKTSADALAMSKKGNRSIAGIALLRILSSSPLDRARYNLSPKALTRAFRAGLPDVLPSLGGAPRELFRQRSALLDRKTVLLVDRRALTPAELAELRELAERAGSRILMGDLPKAARGHGLPLELSTRRGHSLVQGENPSPSKTHALHP